MAHTLQKIFFPATDYKVGYEKRGLFGSDWFSYWVEVSAERASDDIHMETNAQIGKVFVNGAEYGPLNGKH